MTNITFQYFGIINDSEEVHGELIATDKYLARQLLIKQNIQPIILKRKQKLFFDGYFSKISSQDIAIFTRQLATILNAGIPLLSALEIILQTQNNKNFKRILIEMQQQIASGRSMAETFQQYPQQFNTLYCNLIAIGEQSGTLDLMLVKLAQHQEKTNQLKAKIRKASIYPLTVMLISLIITSAMLIFIVPQFAGMLTNFGAKLPMMTKIILALSNQIKHNFWLLIFSITSLVLLHHQGLKYSKHYRFVMDQIKLKIPIVSSIIRAGNVTRISRTLAITFAAGLPLLDALQQLPTITTNCLYKNAIEKISREVRAGNELHSAFSNSTLFPKMLIQLIAIGEQSGTLELMLHKTADHYDAIINNKIDNLTTLFEPIIMLILGSIIGVIVIAMYLPIFKLGVAI